MRKTLIAGNWKMHGTVPETESLVEALLSGGAQSERAEVAVCPPFTSLHVAHKLLSGSHIALGAQDCSAHEAGAYTSEVSVDMLLTVGCKYVILGHSERRQYHSETDQLVNQKAKLALGVGLIPIICVGETEPEREAGRTNEVVGGQIDGTLLGFSEEQVSRSVIAYEPVWAIGTGKTATPEMAQEAHHFIRERIARSAGDAAASAIRILYGGSMKPGNAEGLLRQPDIDGGLIGGASLKADEFIAIIKAA